MSSLLVYVLLSPQIESYARTNAFYQIPGGNTSYAGACAIEYNVPNSVFGTENVGVSNRTDCDDLPAALKPGCQWRFDWFKDAVEPK